MERQKSLSFYRLTLILCLAIGCSKQSPVIEKNEILPPPKQINAQEASRLLTNSNSTEIAVAEINRHRSNDFNWVTFWSELPDQLNFQLLPAQDINSVLSLGVQSCQQKDLDEFGKFIIRTSDLDSKRRYTYLRNLQVAHFACQKNLNNFQIRQTLKLYNQTLIENNNVAGSDEKIRGLEKSYIDYLRFLSSLAHIGLNASEIDLLMQAPLDEVIKPLNASKSIDEIMILFTSLKKMAPYQQQLWEAPLKVLLENENHIVDSLESLRLLELLLILEQVKSFISQRYKDETKLKINQLIIDSYHREVTKRKPVELSETYMGRIIQVSSRVYYLQKTIFAGKLNLFLQANEQFTYEFGHSIRGLSNLFLQENASRIQDNPYFAYLDQYARRIESTNFQETIITDYISLDAFDQYFAKRIQLFVPVQDHNSNTKQQLFSELCEMVGKRDFDFSSNQNKVGCFELNNADELTLNDKQLNLRVSDHAYFKSPGKNLNWEIQAISGGVFNLSSERKHDNQPQVQEDVQNNAIVFPLIIGFKYTGDNQSSACFINGNTYYLPYNFVYREARDGYLPENYPAAKKGFAAGTFRLKVNRQAMQVTPQVIALGGEGQVGAAGMPSGMGRKIRFSEPKIINEFVGMMAGDSNEYVFKACRNINDLIFLINNSERGPQNGIIATKTFIDLGYLNFLKAEDQNWFEEDIKVFQAEQAPYCLDENCLIKALGKEASQYMLNQLLEAQNNGADATDVLLENNTNFNLDGSQQNGQAQSNGSRGENGKLQQSYY